MSPHGKDHAKCGHPKHSMVDRMQDHIVEDVILHTVHRHCLEPNERFSIDSALRHLDHHHRKRQAECVLHWLDDRMTFRKSRPEGRSPFRSWVAYRELTGFRRDLKHKDMFVLLINSELSHARYYEVYKCKHKDDIHMVERLIRQAMEDPDSRLHLDGVALSGSVQQRPQSVVPYPNNTHNNADVAISRRAKSTSPIRTSVRSSWNQRLYASPSTRRTIVIATPPMNQSSPISIQRGSPTIQYVSGYYTPTQKQKNPSVFEGTGYSRSMQQSPVIRKKNAATMSSTPVLGPPSGLIYSGGYPCSNPNSISIGPARYLTIQPLSYQRASQNIIFSGNYSNSVTGKQDSSYVTISPAPVGQQSSPLISSGSYPGTGSSVVTVQLKRYTPVSFMPPRGRSSPMNYTGSNSPRASSLQRERFISVPAKPKPKPNSLKSASPPTAFSRTNSGNYTDELVEEVIIHPDNFVPISSKLNTSYETVNSPSFGYSGADSGFGDGLQLIEEEETCQIAPGLRFGYPERLSNNRSDLQGSRLLSVSTPALNRVCTGSPIESQRKAVNRLGSVTYLNYPQCGDVISQQDGPIYMYAARQPAASRENVFTNGHSIDSSSNIYSEGFALKFKQRF